MPAFKKRRSYKKRTTYKKRFARGGRKSSAVSSAVKKYVNSSIHRNIENKQVELQISTGFGNVVNDPTLRMTPLTPYVGGITIPQGLGSANRTGNEVKVRKSVLKYVLYPSEYNATTNSTIRPCEIMMYLGYVKNAGGFLPTGADVDNLFQYNNTDNPPLGTLMDLNQTINRDYWVIKKSWKHKLGHSIYNGSGGIVGTSEYFANNDFKLNIVKTMDITKYMPKTFKFNDTTTAIQGNGLYLFYQAVAADGTTFASSQLPVKIQFQWSIQYEDA